MATTSEPPIRFARINGRRYGVDTGTLADPDGPQFVDYLEASPTNWASGFAVLTFHGGKLLPPPRSSSR